MVNLCDALRSLKAGNLGALLPDGCGVTEEMAVAFNDVAAMLATCEQERRRLTDAANASANDDLLAVLSHELRTPLNAMLGWVQIVRTGGLDEASLNRALETIERNVQRQAQIIADLVDVSRIVSGKLVTDSLPLPLAPVVSRAVDAARASAKAGGVVLDVHIDAAAGDVRGDSVRLLQVFSNLLSNAIKFTPPGGRVTVELLRDGPSLTFRVTDSGHGIDAEFLPHVFDRFWHSGRISTGSRRGLGLGLTIVRHLVRSHDGVVTAESRGKDLGSTFAVTLPRIVALESAPPIAGPDGSDQARLTSNELHDLHVLVVEDDEDGRELLRAVLEQSGARVTTSADAISAIAALESEVPDVIVSDIGLPGEDGYALIRRVRARSPERGGLTPAVALTAFASQKDHDRAISAGFQAHVCKPLDPADLRAMVARFGGALPGALQC